MVISHVIPSVALATAIGYLSIAYNIAWAYSRTGQTSGRTDHVQLVGYNRSGCGGQCAVLGPLARHLTAQASRFKPALEPT